MPTLKRFSTFTITMYFFDHGAPHFHIRSNHGDASVTIDTLEVIAGDVKAANLKEAKAWAATHKALLNQTWKEFSQ